MDTATFERLRRIVYQKSGIYLRDGKEVMASVRIGKRMKELEISDYRLYLRHLMRDETGNELVQLLDVISTNVTSFFRESEHFAFLGQSVRNWWSKGQTRFRFWSAACSTGEEPYSMAMTLLDVVDDPSVDMKILATDISTRVLAKARIGEYGRESIKPVPAHLRQRFFEGRTGEKDKAMYAVKDSVKSLVVFRRLNLSVVPFPMKGPMDMVFCRNVMIYFDQDMCRKLLAEIHRVLKPGGYLVAGHAESMLCTLGEFKMLKPSIYVKK